MISNAIHRHPFLSLLLLLIWQLLVMRSYASLADSRAKRTFILIMTALCGGLGGSLGVVFNDLKNPRFQLAPYTFAIFMGMITLGLAVADILISWLGHLLTGA
ncbi:hypothetical protein [Streptococcus sp. DD11]|uniref:hypothetical protein n=1 Tax=Streptococcus sp. DD11 TaxID=1777879 RepID=UPI000A9C7B43|nr:hypothetical protein [Streptococcus sp. DD11]